MLNKLKENRKVVVGAIIVLLLVLLLVIFVNARKPAEPEKQELSKVESSEPETKVKEEEETIDLSAKKKDLEIKLDVLETTADRCEQLWETEGISANFEDHFNTASVTKTEAENLIKEVKEAETVTEEVKKEFEAFDEKVSTQYARITAVKDTVKNETERQQQLTQQAETARLEAEEAAEAENQQAEAEKQKTEAENQNVEAKKQESEVERQNVEADQKAGEEAAMLKNEEEQKTTETKTQTEGTASQEVIAVFRGGSIGSYTGSTQQHTYNGSTYTGYVYQSSSGRQILFVPIAGMTTPQDRELVSKTNIGDGSDCLSIDGDHFLLISLN